MKIEDKAKKLAENAYGNITAETLYRSGSSYFKIDYLNDRPIIYYFDQNEHPHFYFYNQLRGIRINNNGYDHGHGWIYDSNFCSAMWITTKGIHFTVGKEGGDRHEFVSHYLIEDVNLESNLFSTEIHIHIGENEDIYMKDVYFLVPKSIFNRQSPYIESAIKFIKDRSINPSSEYVEEKYISITDQIEADLIDKINIPEPEDFDKNSNAIEEYRKIEDVYEEWSNLMKKYEKKEKNIVKKPILTSIPSPTKTESANRASSIYQELDDIGKYIENSLELLDKNDKKHPSIPFNLLHEQIMKDIESDGLPELKRAKEWNEIAVKSDDILNFLSEVDTSQSTIDRDEWIDKIELAVREQYPNVLRPIHTKVERMDGAVWEQSDFDSFTWQEFEGLIGRLYKFLGYETQVTSDTADLGVDVWASKDGEQTAIQAKKYQQGNSVGRETLQKLASTLAKGDADHAVVITTSSFARTAEDYAKEFGPNIEIIDGDELVDMLNNSSLSPPV